MTKTATVYGSGRRRRKASQYSMPTTAVSQKELPSVLSMPPSPHCASSHPRSRRNRSRQSDCRAWPTPQGAATPLRAGVQTLAALRAEG
eukprot:9473828-Pyramimonas_sp.AAC.1